MSSSGQPTSVPSVASAEALAGLCSRDAIKQGSRKKGFHLDRIINCSEVGKYISEYKFNDGLTYSFSCFVHRGKRRRRTAACVPACLTPPTQTEPCVVYRSTPLSQPTYLETFKSIRRYHIWLNKTPKHMIWTKRGWMSINNIYIIYILAHLEIWCGVPDPGLSSGCLRSSEKDNQLAPGHIVVESEQISLVDTHIHEHRHIHVDTHMYTHTRATLVLVLIHYMHTQYSDHNRLYMCVPLLTSKSVLNMAMVTGCPAERSFSLITENNPTECTSVSCCLPPHTEKHCQTRILWK